MTVAVKQLKLVKFPAGHSRLYMGQHDRHVDWGWEYVMQVAPGRGGVYFRDADVSEGECGEITARFNKAALRRCFKQMLLGEAASDGWVLDERTQIRYRPFSASATFEISMPCGTEGCLKKRTIERLIKELA